MFLGNCWAAWTSKEGEEAVGELLITTINDDDYNDDDDRDDDNNGNDTNGDDNNGDDNNDDDGDDDTRDWGQKLPLTMPMMITSLTAKEMMTMTMTIMIMMRVGLERPVPWAEESTGRGRLRLNVVLLWPKALAVFNRLSCIDENSDDDYDCGDDDDARAVTGGFRSLDLGNNCWDDNDDENSFGHSEVDKYTNHLK